MPGKMGPADPSYAGPEEALEMALLEGLLAEASTLLRVLNAKHGSKVVVGARELPPLSPPSGAETHAGGFACAATHEHIC